MAATQHQNRKVRIAVERMLLSADEVAQLLGISRAKAYQMLNAADLPAIRFGKSIRAPRADLLNWIAQHTKQPAAPAA
jgi:excisionase family DNA binding protein